MRGGILKALLLSLAMFIAGYLTAVARLEGNRQSIQDPNTISAYKDKLEVLTTQIKDVVKEHGSKAYTEIGEYLNSLQEEKKADNNDSDAKQIEQK